MSLCAGSLGCRSDQAQCFSNLGFAFTQLGDDEEAAESFILALQGFRDCGDVTSSRNSRLLKCDQVFNLCVRLQRTTWLRYRCVSR